LAFLLYQIPRCGLRDPTNPKHGIDLRLAAMRYVTICALQMKKKAAGIPDFRSYRA